MNGFLKMITRMTLWVSCLFLYPVPMECAGKPTLEGGRPKKIVITGANGWIGYNACKAFKGYQLILVDNKAGYDPTNRFAMEGVDQSISAELRNKIIKIDLATAKGGIKFTELLNVENPDCVLHLAAILENQTITEIEKNNIITANVLNACVKKQVKLIAASSIMVMFGKAVRNQRIKQILFGNLAVKPDYQLSVDDELENNEETILQFGREKYKQYLAYIQTKEYLENYAKKLVKENPNQTIILARFGWTGIKNPYELEKNNYLKGSTFYLAQEDLQTFLIKCVEAILTDKVTKCRKYVVVSEHPQRWVDMHNAKHDLGWEPAINIKEKYS
ncbi:MAG: dependent epimerase/dehydratase family [Alphaproteobacteria bacterium]|nr:dependent epimerase/dehydratase family [Alphaproteobacteria bacterium]